jgi:hypothetical protein
MMFGVFTSLASQFILKYLFSKCSDRDVLQFSPCCFSQALFGNMSDTSGLDNFWGTSSVGDGQVQANFRMQHFS